MSKQALAWMVCFNLTNGNVKTCQMCYDNSLSHQPQGNSTLPKKTPGSPCVFSMHKAHSPSTNARLGFPTWLSG